jgi:hypothetical protein
MVWWLDSFSCGALVGFAAFDVAYFATIGFFCFSGGDLGGMSLLWLEFAPPELSNSSCVDDERGDIYGHEDGLGDDDDGGYGGSLGGIDPSF